MSCDIYRWVTGRNRTVCGRRALAADVCDSLDGCDTLPTRRGSSRPKTIHWTKQNADLASLLAVETT